jgi:hypothetical protein
MRLRLACAACLTLSACSVLESFDDLAPNAREVDEVAIYDKPLSAARILAHYQAGEP